MTEILTNPSLDPKMRAGIGPEKRCSACRKMVPAAEFTIARGKPDGLSAQCRECQAASRRRRVGKIHLRNQRWYARNRRAIKQKVAAYKVAHPEQYREYARRANERRRGALNKKLDEYSASHPKARKARGMVNARVRHGTMVVPDACEICGRPRQEWRLVGHHEDYDKPLAVRWLCHRCHKQLHRAIKEG